MQEISNFSNSGLCLGLALKQFTISADLGLAEDQDMGHVAWASEHAQRYGGVSHAVSLQDDDYGRIEARSATGDCRTAASWSREVDMHAVMRRERRLT